MRTLALLMLSACATTSPAAKGGPRGLHADEHLDLARQHDEYRKQSAQWPDVRSPSTAATSVPWTRSWDADAEHERLAAVHRSRAAELHAAYDEACGARPLAQVSISPLQRHGVSGWNTQTGVIIYLDPSAGPPDRLLADMKCHRAWMMLADAGMDDCPLDLPGIQVDARGDREGIAVSIAIRDPNLVGELHRRAAHELEAAAGLRKSAPR
jgi:hypothetical protein